MNILTSEAIETRVVETFKYLHENGEISWEEEKTTKYIKSILESSGCKTETFEDHTGVIGCFGNFDSNLPVVAIRADIDALWQEINGKFRPNHSCGHDAHMSMVLGVLWKLQEHPELKEQIAVKFIFQPAEEVGTGALKMVEKGVINDVDYLFGIHLRPKQETEMDHATPVIIHGATKMYRAAIIGEDAHGARPHLNYNAIEIGAQIATLLKTIDIDPRIPHSAKMTQFQAGGKSANIIPGSATFSIDMRAQTNEALEILDIEVNKIFNSIKNLYNIKLDILESDGIAAAKTNAEAISIIENAIEKTLGKDNVDPPLMTPGGDDFHFYTIKKPSLKATMIGLGCELGPGLHHPDMTFNTQALMNGVNIMYNAIIDTYKL